MMFFCFKNINSIVCFLYYYIIYGTSISSWSKQPITTDHSSGKCQITKVVYQAIDGKFSGMSEILKNIPLWEL